MPEGPVPVDHLLAAAGDDVLIIAMTEGTSSLAYGAARALAARTPAADALGSGRDAAPGPR